MKTDYTKVFRNGRYQVVSGGATVIHCTTERVADKMIRSFKKNRSIQQIILKEQ